MCLNKVHSGLDQKPATLFEPNHNMLLTTSKHSSTIWYGAGTYPPGTNEVGGNSPPQQKRTHKCNAQTNKTFGIPRQFYNIYVIKA